MHDFIFWIIVLIHFAQYISTYLRYLAIHLHYKFISCAYISYSKAALTLRAVGSLEALLTATLALDAVSVAVAVWDLALVVGDATLLALPARVAVAGATHVHAVTATQHRTHTCNSQKSITQPYKPIKDNTSHSLSQQGVWMTPKPSKITPQDTHFFVSNSSKWQFQPYNWYISRGIEYRYFTLFQ